jgi:hypothetical protein
MTSAKRLALSLKHLLIKDIDMAKMFCFEVIGNSEFMVVQYNTTNIAIGGRDIMLKQTQTAYKMEC